MSAMIFFSLCSGGFYVLNDQFFRLSLLARMMCAWPEYHTWSLKGALSVMYFTGASRCLPVRTGSSYQGRTPVFLGSGEKQETLKKTLEGGRGDGRCGAWWGKKEILIP